MPLEAGLVAGAGALAPAAALARPVAAGARARAPEAVT
jgi:hypothetical protein